MTFTYLSDIDNFLSDFTPAGITSRGVYTLDRMHKLMPVLGNPQEKTQVIHVAGTSGKTSTSYYIASLLSKSGKKVGLSVSPHIFKISERVQINTQPIDEKEFCELFTEFTSIKGVIDLQPSYFEILVAFAYWVFAKKECDFAVIEVGLGGLIDGTNVVSNQNKICVITDIGLDHTNILGESIEEITAQKAGIIMPGNQVFCFSQSQTVDSLIKQITTTKPATLRRLDFERVNENELTKYLPLYQVRNWTLAYEVFKFLQQLYDIKNVEKVDLLDSQKIFIPARMQEIKLKNQTIILDGAHNSQKISTLVKTLRLRYPIDSFSILLSFSNSKTNMLTENVSLLSQLTKDFVVTIFSLSEDNIHKSVDPNKIAQIIQKKGGTVTIVPHDKAITELLSRSSDILLITGSFYLIASLQKDMEGLNDKSNSSD